jgi:hypothetical protein
VDEGLDGIDERAESDRDEDPIPMRSAIANQISRHHDPEAKEEPHELPVVLK